MHDLISAALSALVRSQVYGFARHHGAIAIVVAGVVLFVLSRVVRKRRSL